MGYMIPQAERIEWRSFDLAEGVCNVCGVTAPLMWVGEYAGGCEACFAPGWYAQLSAPGYLDQTEWSGPFDSGSDALAYVMDLYEVDENGDEREEAAS